MRLREGGGGAGGPALDIQRITTAGVLANPDASFAESFGITTSGAPIVGPDGYVCWRTADDAGASRESMARVLASLLSLGERSAT